MLLSDLSIDSISGERSLRIVSRLYCVFRFSETRIIMLNIPVTAADAVRRSSEFDPWGAIRIEGGPVIADLKSCRQKVVSRRKAVKDTGERWFGAGTVASSPVSEAAPRPTVRISDVVEVGVVQYVDERNKVSIVVVDLCQVPGRARGDECRWVLLLQKKTIFSWKSV